MKVYNKFLGEVIDIQPASEPTDIIWENRHFKPRTRQIKSCISIVIIMLMLAGSAGIIFVCSNTSTYYKMRYPIVKCEDFYDKYGGREELDTN